MERNPSDAETQKAVFYRKPININELKEPYDERYATGFVVEKIIELQERDFNIFSHELYGYYRFLYDERELMYVDQNDRCRHCILVTTEKRNDGILIEAEGFAYPRYCAYVPDKRKLNISDPEIQKLDDLSKEIPPIYWEQEETDKNIVISKGR